MEEMLRKKYTNCINFEHTVLLTEPYIEYFMGSHGFRLIEKEYFLDDHSIFYAYIRDTIQYTQLPQGLYQQNRGLYIDYLRYHNTLIADLNKKIEKLPSGSTLYLFGAHVFAQYLIAFGLDLTKVECILDNDLNKRGQRLYGTSLYVEHPSILTTIEHPVVILKAGVYNNEIKSAILQDINSSTVFYE